jgi:hypothetical protein
MTDDPFDRVVRREGELTWRRRMELRTRGDVLRFATLFHALAIGGWALILLGHWALTHGGIVFQIHAVVFALFTAAALFMQIVLRTFGKRMLGDVEHEPPT